MIDWTEYLRQVMFVASMLTWALMHTTIRNIGPMTFEKGE